MDNETTSIKSTMYKVLTFVQFWGEGRYEEKKLRLEF